MIVIAIIAIVAAIAIPNIFSARKHSNETVAIATLKTIQTAEHMLNDMDDGTGIFRFGTLSELAQRQLVDTIVGTGTKNGYFFQAGRSLQTPEYLWWSMAVPASVGSSGDRFFATNHSGIIYYTNVLPPPGSIDFTTCEVFAPPYAIVGK